MNAPLKISKNDPGLAHAMARTMTVAGAASHDRRSSSVKSKNALKQMKDVYGNRLLFLRVKKANGDRACWFAIVAEPTEGGISIKLIFHDKGYEAEKAIAFITDHAIARCLQRSVGVADFNVAFAQMRGLLIAYAETAYQQYGVAVLSKMSLTSSRGVLLGLQERGLMVFKTWLNPEEAEDRGYRVKARTSAEVERQTGSKTKRVVFVEFDGRKL